MNTFWQLVNFENCLDRWIDLEQPDTDLIVAVGQWVMSVADDAYSGARRQHSVAPNYWLTAIPGTRRVNHVVVGTFWIDELVRSVRCDTIATLGLPVG